MSKETDERLQEGFQHLQAAALEMIAAARALLDVAEEVVRDPGDLVQRASSLAAMAERLRPSGPHGTADRSETRVQRIRVS
jgi:hypothetical protein